MTWRIARCIAVAVLLSAVSTACDGTNGCEDALHQTTKLTKEICSEDAYGATPFCSICAKADYLSTTGPTDCRCTLLAYDQGVCSTPSDDEAKSSIREAIRWANQSCKTFTFEDKGEGGSGGGALAPRLGFYARGDTVTDPASGTTASLGIRISTRVIAQCIIACWCSSSAAAPPDASRCPPPGSWTTCGSVASAIQACRLATVRWRVRPRSDHPGLPTGCPNPVDSRRLTSTSGEKDPNPFPRFVSRRWLARSRAA